MGYGIFGIVFIDYVGMSDSIKKMAIGQFLKLASNLSVYDRYAKLKGSWIGHYWNRYWVIVGIGLINNKSPIIVIYFQNPLIENSKINKFWNQNSALVQRDLKV